MMGKAEVEIIDDAVKRITGVMANGSFTREDLEMIKKLFEKGIKITNRVIERGPK